MDGWMGVGGWMDCVWRLGCLGEVLGLTCLGLPDVELHRHPSRDLGVRELHAVVVHGVIFASDLRHLLIGNPGSQN